MTIVDVAAKESGSPGPHVRAMEYSAKVEGVGEEHPLCSPCVEERETWARSLSKLSSWLKAVVVLQTVAGVCAF